MNGFDVAHNWTDTQSKVEYICHIQKQRQDKNALVPCCWIICCKKWCNIRVPELGKVQAHQCHSKCLGKRKYRNNKSKRLTVTRLLSVNTLVLGTTQCFKRKPVKVRFRYSMVSLNILRTQQNRGRAKARGGWGTLVLPWSKTCTPTEVLPGHTWSCPISFRHKAVQSLTRDTHLSSISFQECIKLHRKCKGKFQLSLLER